MNSVEKVQVNKSPHKYSLNCFCNLIQWNAFAKHIAIHISYQTDGPVVLVLTSLQGDFLSNHSLFIYEVFKNFCTMEIKVKVSCEKNQRCMKQQNLSWVACKVRRHGGREGLRKGLFPWCEPANADALREMLVVGTFPLFVEVICLNFDVWHYGENGGTSRRFLLWLTPSGAENNFSKTTKLFKFS